MDKITPLNEEYIYIDEVLISQTDIDGNITYVNNAFCKISGYEMDDIIGSNYNTIRHPNMPKAIFEKLWSNINDGQSWNGLIKNLRKDGHYYWNELSVLPVKDENNSITGFISCARAADRKSIKESEVLYEKMLSSEL